MSTTKDEQTQAAADFKDAFEKGVPETKAQTEDEAFGLTPDEQPGDSPDASAEAPAVAIVLAPEAKDAPAESPAAEASEPAAAEGSPAEEASEPPAEETAEPATEDVAAPAAEAAPALDVEKETQRLKSWEGRLKKMEADMKAKSGDTPAEEAGEPPAEQAAEQAGDSVSAEDASKKLAEDFGDEFVSMIKAIANDSAQKIAGEVAANQVGEMGNKMGEMGKTVQQIIDDIVDTKAKAHFATIAAKYPNFMDIAASPEFKAWVEAQPAEEKAKTVETIDQGNANDIVKMLDAFSAQVPGEAKETSKEEVKEEAAPEAQPEPAADGVSDDELAAAEGVRSSGLLLPETPEMSGDYKKAWDEFK